MIPGELAIMSPVIVQDRCWTIPFVAACSAFFAMLTSSSYGLLYVLFMEEFGVSHEEAAWPQSVYIVAAHSVGLLVTVLQQKMAIYHMGLLGALLACVSLVASSFAPNMAWMSVLLGGAYGAGGGIVIMTLSLYTLTYFEKYCATATAFKYTGWAASGIVGPSLLAYMSENYGCLSSLLLVGAISAHAVPLMMLLKNPRPVKLRFTRRKNFSNAVPDLSTPSNNRNCSNEDLPSRSLLLKGREGQKYSEEWKAVPSQLRKGEPNSETAEVEDLYSQHSERAQGDGQDAPKGHEQNKISSSFTKSQESGSGSGRSKHLMVSTPNFRKHFAALFRSTNLYMLVGSFVAMEYSSSMLETTVVAYGIDKNAGTLNQCNLLQTFIAVGQLAGRLVVPLLSDKIPFSRCPFTAGSLALSAASLVLMSFTNDYIVLAALTTFLGACQGFLLCIKAVLYADYLGVESLGLACGLQGLGMVPVLLSAPAAIGFFRDQRGSYDQFYWMLGILNLLASSVVCCIVVTDKRRRKLWALN
ncbi:monocarboxylate transporter 9-like [Amblyomma americanum]